MNSPSALELYDSICKVLLDADWLESLSINEEIVRKHIDSVYFKKKLNSVIDKNDFSSKSALSLCEDLIGEISGNKYQGDWLYYFYQFSLYKSFPHAVDIELDSELSPSSELFLRVFRVLCRYQKSSDDGTWQSMYPVTFLTLEEEAKLENPEEYRDFLSAFENEYMYEMMKLNQEVMGFNTLDHICGVHYLALFIGRQLQRAGLPVDLGRVSGSAAGHDIGKYGCSKSELKRVPYLHYYYTDNWFKKHNIVYIRHIASNHSTWDLELENLPVESLILIYSDFRVKNRSVEGKNEMHIYSLAQSFDVILDKLDNLDDKKRRRYHRVYAKLKDFEDFMTHLGINVDVSFNNKFNPGISRIKYNYSLMRGREIINNYKYLAINHNIGLMHRLRDEYSLNYILEQARSEKDWKKLREYLQVINEYSTYLTQRQKLITIKFLYEQLTHREDDIRRQCAELMGSLIAAFDEDYRKELPQNATLEDPEITSKELLDKYIQLFIMPDHRIIPSHRNWIGYSLGIMVCSLFTHCRNNQVQQYRDVLLGYYPHKYMEDQEILLYLLEAAKFIPVRDDSEMLDSFYDYILSILDNTNDVIRLSALEVISTYIKFITPDHILSVKVEALIASGKLKAASPFEAHLIREICSIFQSAEDPSYRVQSNESMDISDLFLSNLKTATPRTIKKIQIDMLLMHTLFVSGDNALYTAMHFCNILKVSAVEKVRNHAGEALIQIIPSLSLEQRNDVAIELLRALEIEGYQFAKYIPDYLGKILMFLQPKELNELIDDLYEKIKQSSPKINSLLLKTIGVALVNYPKYKDKFIEDEETYRKRQIKMLGILLNGLANYNLQVKHLSLSVIGNDIFGSRELDLIEKHRIFQLISKKMLTLLMENSADELLFLINSAVLNNIYKFISDYTFFNGEIHLAIPDKIAFFPGTFDPFSLSHKEITKLIRDMGFEVYLAVDEFSWSKQTIPNSIRRNIINMSIADELNIYLFPDEIPINIANPRDLKTLRNNFQYSRVFIVAGSDVVINASGYKEVPSENSIHSFSHIIFDRRNSTDPDDNEQKLLDALSGIDGEVIRLSLKPQYEDISSTQIRGYIDEGRDITSLMDSLAQKYIYDYGLYKREPQYKTVMQPISIEVEVIEEIGTQLINKLASFFGRNYLDALKKLNEHSQKLYSRLILVKDARKNKIIGFSAFHWVRAGSIYNDVKNSMISEYIRENAVGRIIMLDGIFTERPSENDSLEQILLTETLSFCMAKDYDYAVFNNTIANYHSPSLYDILELQGFQRLLYSDDGNPVFVVNMNSPSTLNLDIKSFIKEPFRNNENVIQSISRSRSRLQKALTMLYPGHLVLSFERKMLHETLIKKICLENDVPTLPVLPRKLGPAMCVPFGNILKRHVVPNTVTKSLHTEKFFQPDMKSNRIDSSLYYLDLGNQVKTLHSFNRPIILVDDLLHKGYRIKALDPLFKQENIKVKKIIVGILSGRGKELMDMQNREIESAYFIPKLRCWFNESSMYPFIGGDTLWRGVYPQKYFTPSINLILPYTSPGFIKNASRESIYILSNVCIENAIDILSTLEREYQLMHERNLTLGSLGEVFISPRCPDHGRDMSYDFNLSPSHYLMNDMELLQRMEYTINME